MARPVMHYVNISTSPSAAEILMAWEHWESLVAGWLSVFLGVPQEGPGSVCGRPVTRRVVPERRPSWPLAPGAA